MRLPPRKQRRIIRAALWLPAVALLSLWIASFLWYIQCNSTASSPGGPSNIRSQLSNGRFTLMVKSIFDTALLTGGTPAGTSSLGYGMTIDGYRLKDRDAVWRPGSLSYAHWDIQIVPGCYYTPLIYPAILLCAPPLLVRAWHKRKYPAHACQDCAYNRTGLQPNTPCPECGAPA